MKKNKARLTSNKKKHKYFLSIRSLLVIGGVLSFVFVWYVSQTILWQNFITGKEQFIKNDPTQTVGIFHGKQITVPPPSTEKNYKLVSNDVLGDTANKRIEIDLTNQKVYTFEGDGKVHEFIVSTGKYGWTPTGEFTIERRVRVQAMKGGNKALGTYYYLPNVEFVQYFGNKKIPWWRGFSFHSAYWHNNFGHPMSHGCINMKREDAEILWNWAGEGVRVVIYGTTPPS